MLYQKTFNNLLERNEYVGLAESLRHQVIHCDYDADWVEGTEPHGVLTIDDSPIGPTPEELYQKELVLEFNDIHTQAILAYKNWASLTLAQKDTILKNLVKWALWKDGYLKLGVL